MRTETFNAVVAVVGGVVLAVAGFVPAAALHYRRSGRFTVADLAALVVIPVYGLALWTYTLLPLPDPTDLVCRSATVEPLRAVGDIRGAWNGSVLDLVRDPLFLQVALNVALFVPMGVLLRVRYRRGLLWAAGLGLSVSLLIETTQLTGIWGLYQCAYRVFDVDDLVFNTAGAVLGSLAALVVTGRRGADGGGGEGSTAPATVPTVGRRLVAIASDLLTMLFVGAAAVVVWRVGQIELRGLAPAELDPQRQAMVQWGAALAVEAVAVLGRGATVGELVVRIRTRARRRWWTAPARLVKLVTGVGAVAVLGAWDSPWSSFSLVVLLVAMGTAAITTRGFRGLANLLAGLDVVVLAPPAATDPPPREQAHPQDRPQG